MSNEYKRAYIAGKVQNLDTATASSLFANKENELLAQGYNAVSNPISLISELNQRLAEFKQRPLSDYIPEDRIKIMNACVAELAMCDEVHLLHNWQDSKGAQMERQIALIMGKKIVYP